jgi:hypothetical protein
MEFVDARDYLKWGAHFAVEARDLTIPEAERLEPSSSGSGKPYYAVLGNEVYREDTKATAKITSTHAVARLQAKNGTGNILCGDLLILTADDVTKPFSQKGDFGVKIRRVEDNKVVGFILTGPAEPPDGRCCLAPAYGPSA